MERHPLNVSSNSATQTSLSTTSSFNDDDKATTPKKGYVPIEKWDQERKQKLDSMSWEERMQFDAQKYGNQFKQNEILRQNLKAW